MSLMHCRRRCLGVKMRISFAREIERMNGRKKEACVKRFLHSHFNFVNEMSMERQREQETKDDDRDLLRQLLLATFIVNMKQKTVSRR